MIARETFAIAYDGEALRTHVMDVRELAPALLAMADLVDAVNEQVNPPNTEVRVRLRAAGDGSLVVHLALDLTFWQTVQHIFTAEPVQALLNIKEVLVGGGTGLFFLLRKLRGQYPPEIGAIIDRMVVPIMLPDGTTLEVPRSVYIAARNDQARAAASKVLAPLRDPGIDEFRIYASDDVQQAPVEIVTADDVEAFTPEPVDVEDLDEIESDRLVQLVTPQFDRKYKWRFTDGSTFYADMADETFWDAVENRHQLFGAGDVMYIRLRSKPRMVGNKLTTAHEVIKVYEHRPNAGQGVLDL